MYCTLVFIQAIRRQSASASSLSDSSASEIISVVSAIIVRNVKIIGPECSERHSLAQVFRHSAQFIAHACIDECLGENSSLFYPNNK